MDNEEKSLNTIIRNVTDSDAFDIACKILQDGGLVAFPTETVYGLGGDGLRAESSEKIYAAKGRPSDNPLIIHIADSGQGPYSYGSLLAGSSYRNT